MDQRLQRPPYAALGAADECPVEPTIDFGSIHVEPRRDPGRQTHDLLAPELLGAQDGDVVDKLH
jgi:hypothetical protein